MTDHAKCKVNVHAMACIHPYICMTMQDAQLLLHEEGSLLHTPIAVRSHSGADSAAASHEQSEAGMGTPSSSIPPGVSTLQSVRSGSQGYSLEGPAGGGPSTPHSIKLPVSCASLFCDPCCSHML